MQYAYYKRRIQEKEHTIHGKKNGVTMLSSVDEVQTARGSGSWLTLKYHVLYKTIKLLLAVGYELLNFNLL